MCMLKKKATLFGWWCYSKNIVGIQTVYGYVIYLSMGCPKYCIKRKQKQIHAQKQNNDTSQQNASTLLPRKKYDYMDKCEDLEDAPEIVASCEMTWQEMIIFFKVFGQIRNYSFQSVRQQMGSCISSSCSLKLYMTIWYYIQRMTSTTCWYFLVVIVKGIKSYFLLFGCQINLDILYYDISACYLIIIFVTMCTIY